MSNIASVLKEEIARLVRRQLRGETENLKKASSRFKPQGVRAQRTRLGLSAPEMGALVGVSAQTIYNWETGTSRPRAEQLAVIAVVRKMGKREVKARLDQLRAE